MLSNGKPTSGMRWVEQQLDFRPDWDLALQAIRTYLISLWCGEYDP